MTLETVLVLGGEAAAGASIRAMYDEDPVLLGTLTGLTLSLALVVLPVDLRSALLSAVVTFGASTITKEIIKKEFF